MGSLDENLLFADRQYFTFSEEYHVAAGFALTAFMDFCNNSKACTIPDSKKQELYVRLINDIARGNRDIMENLHGWELSGMAKADVLKRNKNYYASRYPIYKDSPVMQSALAVVSEYEWEMLEG